jgi:hypothetical protein
VIKNLSHCTTRDFLLRQQIKALTMHKLQKGDLKLKCFTQINPNNNNLGGDSFRIEPLPTADGCP